jgi:ribonuclease P protein 1
MMLFILSEGLLILVGVVFFREKNRDYAFLIIAGKKPLTFGKAKRENIKHQRFPIDRYVKFGGGGGKSLTIDQVYNILMTLKHTGSWVDALKYIP